MQSSSIRRVLPSAALRRLLAALLLPLGATLLPLDLSAQASSIPNLISYQGFVTDSAGLPLANTAPINRTITFRIWNHPTDSLEPNLVYSEQQVVTIFKGEFNALIGNGSATTTTTGTTLIYSETAKGKPTVTIGAPNVFNVANPNPAIQEVRYVGVTVDDGTIANDAEISPRQQLVATPFAFRAKYAESLGTNGTTAITALNGGNVGIGNGAPAEKLHVSGNVLASGTNASVKVGNVAGNTVGQLGQATSGGTFSTDAAAGDVVLRAESAKLLFQSGSGGSAIAITSANDVGIGTATPTGKLQVNGRLTVSDGGSNLMRGGLVTENGTGMINFGMNDARFTSPSNAAQGGFFRVNTEAASQVIEIFTRSPNASNASQAVTITHAGNMAVGYGAAAAAVRMDVNGSVRATGADGFTFGGGGDADGGLFSPSDGIVTVKTNNTERVRFDSGGNVGIGTSSPSQKLDVNGTARVNGLSVGDSGYTQNSVGAFNVDASGVVGGRMTVTTGGNVGIGTASPTQKLDVNGVGKFNGGAQIGNVSQGFLADGNNVGLRLLPGDAGHFYFQKNAGSSTLMIIRNSGQVGIGTDNPGAPLEVKGKPDITFNEEAYLFTGGAGDTANQSRTLPISIISEGGLLARGVHILSDERIKKIVGISSGMEDLVSLRQIEVTDYSYRDVVTHGRQVQKKVVAQQVEKVFPMAVSNSTSVVPDIYRMGKIVDGWVQLATDLKVGDRVQLIAGEKREIHEVLEAKADRFRTAFKPSKDRVFVYGREVNDFRSVDYEAIAMLNVSATQEIARQVEKLQASEARNAELAARVGELTKRLADVEAKDNARDTKLASIEKLLQSSQTVMAQPAKAATANGQE